jgi:hypothetical protein
MGAGCASPEGPLVLPEDWVLVDPEDDPWPGVPPEAEACSRRALRVEVGTIELDTAVCDWITATAPARIDVRPGRALELLAWHAPLVAEDVAEATMGVRTEAGAVWEVEVPVPAASAFYDVQVTVPERVREGDPLYLHVHNHGNNSYRLAHLRTLEDLEE